MRQKILCSVCILGLVFALPVTAGRVNVPGFSGNFTVPASSLKEARWESVVRQQYDFSCGSAAIATLLSFHYDRQVSEAEVFETMFRAGNQDKIRADGFSMLDMKKYLDDVGLRSDGFRMNLDQLSGIGVPAIALVNTNGYRHFVVVRGMREDDVLLADPAIGSIKVPREHFEAIWDGTVLASRDSLMVARENFNAERDWRVWPKAPLRQAPDRAGLGMFLLSLPGRNELGR